MQIINKKEIANDILLKYISELSLAKEKISCFAGKYSMNFKVFEKKINNNKKEVFSEWDDYLEWKSYIKVYTDLTEKIKDIRSGNFKVA